MSRHLAGLAAPGASPALVEPLFRDAHTLHGDARLVGHDASAELAGCLEDIFAAHLEAGIVPSGSELDELARLLQALERSLAADDA
jgi:chemotaxis protein histidine kinase CheA